jgi:Do/DeqQ family serine protease
MQSIRLSTVAAILVLFVAPSACAQNSQGAQNDANRTESPDPAARADAGSVGKSSQKRLEIISQLPGVVDQALPGVVGLSTRRVVESDPHRFPFGDHPFFRNMPFGQKRPEGQQRQQRGIGSGVIVDKDGTIVTNNHVVEGADEIKVRLSDHRQQLDAKIIGSDKATDLAVLKLENPPEDLQPLPFGNSGNLRLGQPVVAIGNPFGLSGSVTYGIVSATGRQDVGLADYEDFIQTDAAINPGNSGGALVNMEGELIGINTAILSRSGGYQGIGFAIPSKMVRSVTRQLVEKGEVQRGHLGVLIQDLSPELAEAFDVPEGTAGAVVSRVQPESPAEEAGLQQGDVLIEFDGKPVESATGLRNRVAHTPPGETVELQVIRDGNRQTLEVELGTLQGAGGGPRELEKQGMLKGLVLGPVDQQAREEFELPDEIDQGIVVRKVKPGSPASRSGLRPGDVILEVNRQEVASIEDLTGAYQQADRRILLLVYRDQGTLFLAIPKVDR